MMFYCHGMVFTDTASTSIRQCSYFFPSKIVRLAELMFISLVLFQFDCYPLSVEAFK